MSTNTKAKGFISQRRIASMGTIRTRSRYRKVPMEETFPRYESLATVLHILSDVLESPESWSHAKLREMTARDADWKAMKSAPPNNAAKGLALRVLRLAHALRPIEPSLTASADGGIGIVYKSDQTYAAIECLNAGRLWLLWFDANREPQSRRIKNTDLDIKKALECAAALHANA
jgi:hypothetical protein